MEEIIIDSILVAMDDMATDGYPLQQIEEEQFVNIQNQKEND